MEFGVDAPSTPLVCFFGFDGLFGKVGFTPSSVSSLLADQRVARKVGACWEAQSEGQRYSLCLPGGANFSVYRGGRKGLKGVLA